MAVPDCPLLLPGLLFCCLRSWQPLLEALKSELTCSTTPHTAVSALGPGCAMDHPRMEVLRLVSARVLLPVHVHASAAWRPVARPAVGLGCSALTALSPSCRGQHAEASDDGPDS